MGEHDLIGTVEIDLELDVLQGNHQDDPSTSEWYTIQLEGKGDRGQLHITFQWHNRVRPHDNRLVARDLDKIRLSRSRNPSRPTALPLPL